MKQKQLMSSEKKHSGKHQATQKPDDRLRRETPFLCNVKFRNGLPEVGCSLEAMNHRSGPDTGSRLKGADWPQVPCDPKLLISPLDKEGIAKFQLTTIEQQMRQDVPLDGGSGIQISMLDIDSYAVPENPAPLHPDDKALLMVREPSSLLQDYVIYDRTMHLNSPTADAGQSWESQMVYRPYQPCLWVLCTEHHWKAEGYRVTFCCSVAGSRRGCS